MKTRLFSSLLFVTAAVGGLTGCKEDSNNNTPSQTLEDRLVGEWTMTALFYDTEIPNPAVPGTTIPLSGNADNVSGDFIVTQNPNEVDYTLIFSVTLPPPLVGGVPINIARSGTWTVTGDEKRVIVEDASNGELILYDVLVNEPNRQVWASEVPFSIPGTGLTLFSDIEFTLERQ